MRKGLNKKVFSGFLVSAVLIVILVSLILPWFGNLFEKSILFAPGDIIISGLTPAPPATNITILHVGDKYYTDRDYQIKSALPAMLDGHVAIRMSNDASISVSFSVNQNARIYLAWDMRESVPSGWTSTTDKISVSDTSASNGGYLQLIYKDFATGKVVVPARTTKSNYITFVLPQTQFISNFCSQIGTYSNTDTSSSIFPYCCFLGKSVDSDSIAVGDQYDRFLCYNGQLFVHDGVNEGTIRVQNSCAKVGNYYAFPNYPNAEWQGGWKSGNGLGTICGANKVCNGQGQCIDEKINNNGFEQALNSATDWSSSGTNVLADSSQKHSGLKSLKISGSGYSLQKPSALKGADGKKFTLTLWAKNSSTVKLNGKVGIQGSTSWGLPAERSINFAGISDQWKQFSVTFALPTTDSDLNYHVVLGTESTNQGIVWFDDVSLVEVGNVVPQDSCINTDGSENSGKLIDVKGKAYNSSVEQSDKCFDINSVNETWCNGKAVESEILSCARGKLCKDGICVADCSDDDSINSVSAIGTCWDIINNVRVPHPDMCDSVGKLWQANCDTNKLCGATYSICPTGTTCKNGMCAPCKTGECGIVIQDICTDTDNGKIIDVKGKAYNSISGDVWDKCFDINSVNETLCDGLDVKTEVLPCGTGKICFEGTCISEKVNLVSLTNSDIGQNICGGYIDLKCTTNATIPDLSRQGVEPVFNVSTALFEFLGNSASAPTIYVFRVYVDKSLSGKYYLGCKLAGYVPTYKVNKTIQQDYSISACPAPDEKHCSLPGSDLSQKLYDIGDKKTIWSKPAYCAVGGNWEEQKGNNEDCDEDYECLSDKCDSDGECTNPGSVSAVTCYALGKNVSVGTKVGNQYCASDGTLDNLKSNGAICSYYYECSSSSCVGGKCSSASSDSSSSSGSSSSSSSSDSSSDSSSSGSSSSDGSSSSSSVECSTNSDCSDGELCDADGNCVKSGNGIFWIIFFILLILSIIVLVIIWFIYKKKKLGSEPGRRLKIIPKNIPPRGSPISPSSPRPMNYGNRNF